MFIVRKLEHCRATVLTPLRVLMWKYLIVQRHRYFHTLWEFFGGVIVFLVLFAVNQTLTYRIKITTPKINGSITRLYYAPHNAFTQKLMSKAWIKLHNPNIDTDLDTNINWEFENDNVVIPDMNKLKPEDNMVVVHFKSNKSVARNSSLVYSINMKEDVKLTELDRIYNGFFHGLVPPDEPNVPVLETLQWAIDTAYMEQLTQRTIDQKVKLQPKPIYVSRELRALHKFMILFTIVAPLPFFLINSSQLVQERRTGLKELMKLSGISHNVLRFSHLLQTTIVAVLYAIPVTCILKTSPTSIGPILPYSDEKIIFLTLLLHFVNSASLAYVTTTITEDRNHADSLGLLIYLATLMLDFLWHSSDINRVMTYLLCCLLPHVPVYMFWDEVLHLEWSGQGIQLWNMKKFHTNNEIPVIDVLYTFCIQMVIIWTIAWYLDSVRPGTYGISKKWNFMLKIATAPHSPPSREKRTIIEDCSSVVLRPPHAQGAAPRLINVKDYWWGQKQRKTVNFREKKEELPNKYVREEKYFERGPRYAQVAIKVVNVTKIFKPSRKVAGTVALNSVHFDCYQGEVTVVLGANGAGKTTLLSLATGMFSATSGAVYINGLDVAHKITELRDDIALCPQRDLHFDYLTVKENILFYDKLRKKKSEGFTIEQLMKKLKLTEKSNLYTKQLTHGMLRSLQVACAVATSADVLVLDEPTSGMDVEVRHRFWDLIMVLRGKKTILMSTTFLEEASALGDRIVILDHGELRCHGTPMFLKDAIGVSFNLTITIKDSTQMKYLKEIVEKVIPDVRHRVHDIRRITFSLPSKEHEKFPEMFDTLEANKVDLGITLMDVGMFTEELFLEFVEEEPADEQVVRASLSYRHVDSSQAVGLKLKIKQMKLLIKRVYQHSWLKKYQFIILQILIPMLGLILVTLTTNHSLGYDAMYRFEIMKLQGDVDTVVYNTGSLRRSGLEDTVAMLPGVRAVFSEDVDADFTNSTTTNKKGTIGLKMGEKISEIFYSPDPKIASRTMNIYSNVYMKMHMPDYNNTIRTKYEPGKIWRVVKEPKTVYLCLKWAVWVVFLSVLPLAPLIILCITEYRAGTRDNHMMAGCTPIVHWGAKLLAHMSEYLAIIPPVLLLTLFFDFDRTFNELHFLGSLFLFLLAFGPAFLTYLYLLSFIFRDHVALCYIYVSSLCFGILFPIATSVLESQFDSNLVAAIIFIILSIFARFHPLYTFTVGIGRLTMRARLNAYCRINRKLCPDIVGDVWTFKPKVCCESTSRAPFRFLYNYRSGLYDLINLIILFLFYSLMVLLLENRVLHSIAEKFVCYRRPPAHKLEIHVKRERDYVENAIKYGKTTDDVLLVHKVHKTYMSSLIRTRNVVRGVSFAAKIGECIAILGPQDCGKSTLLDMLAGSTVMTRGNACIDGNFIRKNRSKYIHKISLTSPCGLDDFMTGHQNLVLMGKLMGYSEVMATKLSLLALRFMGLRRNATEVSKYSTGCLRRLSLCNTLVLAPLVALLDEPMRDTDANTKPLIAKAIQRLLLEPATVVLTEETVDWRQMQHVFTRIALMSKGQFAVIGPAEQVIQGLAKGYTARIKLKVFTAYRYDRASKIHTFDVDSAESSSESEEEEPTMHSEKSVVYAQGIVAFKRDFKKMFETSTCTGEHLCMLYFDIQDPQKKLLYSDMFQKLEELKIKYNDVVEDYTLSSTTVEDVFYKLAYKMHTRHRINIRSQVQDSSIFFD